MRANLAADLCRLLSSLDIEQAQQHSTWDHHAIGFDYLCLFRSDVVTVKLYMSRPDELVTCGNRDYLVNPHDHGYDFDTWVIDGWVENVDFQASRGDARHGVEYQAHRFDWQTKSLVPAECMRLRDDRIRYWPGDRYRLRDYDIHTIVVPRNAPVCMFLVQREDTRDSTRLFLRPGEAVSTDGLYQRPTMDQMRLLRERALMHASRLAEASK